MNKIHSRNILGQLITIFCIQATSTTAYAVFYSGLSIYLTQNKFFSQESAAAITGLFLSLNYALPLVGGIIANKIISYKKMYLLGTFFSLGGCICLAFTGFLYLSLALFLIGSITNICLNIFLTQLFIPEQKIERRIAFICNYVGMNLGFMIGYFLTGISTLNNSYFYLFVTISFAILISLILAFFFIKEPNLKREIRKPTFQQIKVCTLVFVCITLIICTLFQFIKIIQGYITIVSILTLGLVFMYGLSKTKNNETKNLINFILFSILAIIFWSFYLLTPVAILQLIEHNTQRKIFGIEFATQWIININTIVILIFAPLLAILFRIKKEFFSQSEKYFSIAFACAGCGFIFLTYGVNYFSSLNYIPLFFVLCFLVSITFGEIFLSPSSNSLIGELIPESLRGLMTGAWGMNICLGGLFASILANKFILPCIANHGLNGITALQLSKVFIFFSVILFTLALSIAIKYKSSFRNMIENI